MDNSTMFQKIYDCISLYVSIDWKKIVFYAEYEEGSYTIEFYVKDFNNKYIKCYALPNVDELAKHIVGTVYDPTGGKLTGSDITIPYSSIEVKSNAWYNYITMQAYTRTYYFDNAPRILNDTAFPQSGSFGDNTTYRVQLEQKELSDITPKVQNFQLPENKKYLAEKIKTLQWSLTPHLFEYIPKRLDVRDININNASIASADADNNIITLNFTLKCIYNKQGLKEQNFTLYLVSKNYNGPITGTYSASQNSRSTVTAVKEASDSNSSGVVNNQRQWINESECSTAVTFSFKNPVKNPAA